MMMMIREGGSHESMAQLGTQFHVVIRAGRGQDGSYVKHLSQ